MNTEEPADPAVDDLAALLFGLDGGRLTTSRMTRRITNTIAEWALARGWTVRTEARVAVPANLQDDSGQLGFVDVIVRRGDGQPDLAIEIDSAHKPWSVDKLRHAARAGMHAVWIRWGADDWPGVYEDIDVIQLRLARAPARRETAPQASLWPDRPGRAERRNSTAFRPTTPSTTD